MPLISLKSMNLFLVFTLLLACRSNARYLQLQDDNLLRNGKLMSNANFNFYDNNPQRKLLTSLPEWTINQIQQGIGGYYNPRWGNKLVISLDYYKNFFLRQTVPLIKGIYSFEMKFAARSGWAGSSGMSIYWNLQRLKTIFPQDQEIKYLNIELQPQGTQNTIQIRGQGVEDSYGMTIADLKLSYKGPMKLKSYGVSLINTQAYGISSIEQARYPTSTDINREIQMVNGYLYNRRWGLSKVILMNQSANRILRQNLMLKPQYYVFQMDYAVPTNYARKAGISLYWNGNLMKRLMPQDESIQRLSLPLVGQNRQNNLILQLQPQIGDSAMTISNFKVIPTNISTSFQLANTKSPIKNQINLIPSSLFGSQMTNLVPYWQSRGFIQNMGYNFNSRWQDKVVLIQDPRSNGFLRRSIQLQRGIYSFLVDFAAKDGVEVYPKLITYINDQPVGILQPKSNQIYSYNLSFRVNAPTRYNLQLRGDSNNVGDGISLYNPQVISSTTKVSTMSTNNTKIIPLKAISDISQLDNNSLSVIALPKQLFQYIPYLMQPSPPPKPQVIVINQRQIQPQQLQVEPQVSEPVASVLIGNMPIIQSQLKVTNSTSQNKIGNIDFADFPVTLISNITTTQTINPNNPNIPTISNPFTDGTNPSAIKPRTTQNQEMPK